LRKSIKAVARRLLSARARHFLWKLAGNLQMRSRDFAPDLGDRLWPRRGEDPLPPARLRRAVALTSSRREYLGHGRELAAALVKAFQVHRNPAREYPRWLDFGCGSGRVARFLRQEPFVCELVGVDVDAGAIDWARRHLRGAEYRWISPQPPMPFPSASFDVVVAVSVFTHLDEAPQLAWLAEIRRLLRPGGLLLSSTHSDRLAFIRPDLPVDGHRKLQEAGFVFASGPGPFNEDTAFHSRCYLERTWAPALTLKEHVTHGLAGFQDLSTWELPTENTR
jgi:SAM-dependent methyltransferase